MIRRRLRRRLRRQLHSRLCNETQDRTKTSAIVFAPHQDDETLGCGGTILLKRLAGAAVACVFMADGSSSHKRFISEEELRELRKEEALEAAEVLGVHRGHVHFLDFPDGKLREFHEAAVEKASNFLAYYRPEEVYVPYRTDGLPDHEHTFSIVQDALEKADIAVQICEYPVWAWNRWPWVPVAIRFNRDGSRALLRTVRAGCGLGVMREFRSGVFVGNILDIKKQALSRHRSQMTVLRPGTPWPTLEEVSGGEFIKCFFQEFEVFRCRQKEASQGASCSA